MLSAQASARAPSSKDTGSLSAMISLTERAIGVFERWPKIAVGNFSEVGEILAPEGLIEAVVRFNIF